MNALVQAAVGEVIADLGRRRSYAPGDLLFVEGDHSHDVYVCLEGRVRIFLTMPSGRELLVGIKLPGDEFGELSALDGRPRSASAAAIDQTVVAELPRAASSTRSSINHTSRWRSVRTSVPSSGGRTIASSPAIRTTRPYAPAGCSSNWRR